jgi:hypothetical protein
MKENSKQSLLPLSQEEWHQWTELTKRIQFIDGRIPLEAFYAYCESFITPVIDLVPYRITNNVLEILLIYRKDKYYNGFHVPGSVITPRKTSKETLQYIIENELGHKASIERTFFIKVVDTMKGKGVGLDERGQDLKLLYACEVMGEAIEGEWFSKNNLPKNIIPEHQEIVLEIFDLINQKSTNK